MMNEGTVDPREMELRRDKDFIASLNMVGEGAPVYEAENEENTENNSVDTSDKKSSSS
jgi:hypothetical protein